MGGLVRHQLFRQALRKIARIAPAGGEGEADQLADLAANERAHARNVGFRDVEIATRRLGARVPQPLAHQERIERRQAGEDAEQFEIGFERGVVGIAVARFAEPAIEAALAHENRDAAQLQLLGRDTARSPWWRSWWGG